MTSRNYAPQPGQGGRGSRERQSVWCCGANYSRWRFIGREFPDTHHTHCVHCGQALIWPAGELIRARQGRGRVLHNRKIWNASARRRAEQFVKQGLTTKGTPRRRRSSISEQERAWREFRASLGDLTVPEVQITTLRGYE